MWNKILTEDYFLENNNESEIYVTNFVSLWFTHFSQESFLACLKKSNPGLEMCDEKYLEYGKQMLTNPSDLKNVTIEEVSNILEIKMAKSFGYTFRIHLRLIQGSKELFFQRVTQRLLRSMEALSRSERALIQLLQKKDEEIEEYKSEGGEIALRHLKTVPFHVEAHMARYKQQGDTFVSGHCQLPDSVLHKTVDVPELRIKSEPVHTNGTTKEIKQEPKTEIKQEENSQINTASSTTSVKLEPAVKIEPSSQYNQGVSPSKRQRRKFNL